MTRRAIGRSGVVHGRRRPGTADRMTTTAGNRCHWRCRVGFGTGSRTPGCGSPVVAACTIAAGRNIAVRKRGRLPGHGRVAAVALCIAGGRNMGGFLAGRAHAVMAVGTAACRRHLAMIE